MGVILTLLLGLVVVLISMAILHYVIVSALNDSKLTRRMKQMQDTLNEMQQALERLSPPPQEAQATPAGPAGSSPEKDLVIEACPACSSPVTPQQLECPDCGLSLRDDPNAT